MKDIKLGQTIWFSTAYEPINCGTVSGISMSTHGEMAVTIRENSIIIPACKCYDTEEELKNVLKQEFDKRVQDYCDEISDVKALVAFCFAHNMAAEEYTNYEARQAAQIRAKDLLDLTLE